MSRPAKETQAHIGAAVAGSLDPERKRFLVGLRMLLESDYPAVVAYFDQLADDYPGNRDAIYGQFEALFHGGHPLEAVATYRRVIELAPGFGLGLMHPLAYHISRGDDRGARWALDRAGSSPGVWHVRALVAQRRHGEALALARELLRGASDEDAVGRAGALAEIAAIHAAAGRLDEAEAIDGANRASLLAARGDRAGADAAHDEALAAAIALPEGIARYDAVLQVAFARSPDSRADEARPIVEALEQSSPQFSESLISRAAAAILYGHLSESEHIDSASNSPYPEVSAIGQAFSREAAADWPGAADAWRRAIASNGDGRLRVTEQFLLARALRRAERFEAVIAACDEVILPHLFSWAWGEAVGPCLLWTAQAHEALGRHRDACRTTDRLASMRDRAPRRDPVLAAARALDCE
jgi:tetratricopeptide (TPR) repeat protein